MSLAPPALRRATLASAFAALALAAPALCRPAAAGETDFVKAALAHGGFKAFVALASRADLADTLGASPVTVFMPTDGAFARLSAAQWKAIADLSPQGVRDFVGRFVFPGVAMASNDVDKTITSENGTTFDVTWYAGRLSLRDHRGPATGRLAFVVEGDLPAGLGVIDAVDAVLMPTGAGGSPVAAAAPAPTAAAAAAPLPASTATSTAAPAVASATPAPTAAKPGTMTPAAARPAGPDAPVPVAAVTNPPAPTLPSKPATTVVTVVTAAVPAKPEISVAAAGLRGWPLKVAGQGSTGRVSRVLIGLPDGRITGLSAHFGGFFGFGGRDIYVPWDRVMPDAAAHVLRVRMTAAEFAAAPARVPKP